VPPRQRTGSSRRSRASHQRSISEDDEDETEEADISRFDAGDEEEESEDELDVLGTTGSAAGSAVLDARSHAVTSSMPNAVLRSFRTKDVSKPLSPPRNKQTITRSVSDSEGSTEDSELFRDISSSSLDDELADDDSILDEDDSRDCSANADDTYSDVDSDSETDHGDASFQPDTPSASESSENDEHKGAAPPASDSDDGDSEDELDSDMEEKKAEAEEMSRAAIACRKAELGVALAEDRWAVPDAKTVKAVMEVFRAILNTVGRFQVPSSHIC
jgi:hypothetical protein